MLVVSFGTLNEVRHGKQNPHKITLCPLISAKFENRRVTQFHKTRGRVQLDRLVCLPDAYQMTSLWSSSLNFICEG